MRAATASLAHASLAEAQAPPRPPHSAGAFEPAATALEKYLVASDSGVTLQVNSTALPEDASVVVDTFAAIKHHVAGAPYKHLLTHLQAGTSVSLTPFCVNFKGTETTYFLPGPDRVMFAYGMQFPDPTDAALVRVLCQQFADVQRTMGAAPAVSVCELGATGQTVPREITDSGLPLLTQGGEGFSGYIALTFFQGHVDDATKLANTLTLASTFRTYITYHLKAAKSYIHSRMRNRVDSLLQVLKRAHTSDPTKPKVKKGFSGKTLKQRP